MNRIGIFLLLLLSISLTNCSKNKLDEKGFSVAPQSSPEEDETEIDGIVNDTLELLTRPSTVILTGHPVHRLTTIYKVNHHKKTGKPFIGSNYYHWNYSDISHNEGNQWNYNFMPGIEAVYGYNMVNVSHNNIETKTRKDFFETPVLIKTLYFPSFSKDTLNYKPLQRNFYMISVYDEDTNEDGLINVKDLRRFYYFDINAGNKQALIPKNYSVISSEYDSANDFMFVFAKLDQNENGSRDEGEEIHVYWIDLNNPLRTGRQY